MPTPRKYTDVAERQRAYRERKLADEIAAREAARKLRKIERAVRAGLKNGTLPAEMFGDSEFANWIDNLVDYLTTQRVLELPKRNKAPRKK